MNNQNVDNTTTVNQVAANNQTPIYDTNIESTRLNATQNMNVGQNPYINQPLNVNQQPVQNTQNGFNNADFIKGALIGAAATYLLTNKNAQQTIMKAFSKGTELFQAGMEELKERYEDAKAQMEAQNNQES
jgi:hypothetical protein